MKHTILIISFLIVNYSLSIATIRYVSHSGSSTPPYTSWETAADSIQKCIDYSFDGDTIIVANGTYYESLVVDKYLSLVGSSMDSTVIDGTGLALTTVDFQADGNVQSFIIKGRGEMIPNTSCITANSTNAIINDCRIMNAIGGIGLIWSSSIVDRCIITNVGEGYGTYCAIDTCNPVIKNSIIFNNSEFSAVKIEGGSNTAINNNIIVDVYGAANGIDVGYYAIRNIIQNNIVTGYYINIEGISTDTSIVNNNISSDATLKGYIINSKTEMRNNISIRNNIGLDYPSIAHSDYNLYWKNNINSTDSLATHDIIADPMFVNDTIPANGGSYNFHLQAYSPAIDAGDPDILDVDGTRSDIGAYGGPLGQSYKYQDLPPRPPVNLSGEYDSLNIKIRWNRNTEADLNRYNIYRDTIPDFPADSTTYVVSLTDTIYSHIVQPGIRTYYYKITAVDNQGNESLPSEELAVIISGTIKNEQFRINDYKLFQNYPNPFNPSTKIGYRLKDRGYVKLMVYDIKGEMIKVLVNKVEEAGYHEVTFGVTQDSNPEIASGIYLYRIEVIGEGRIPRFSDMKKMILLK